MLFLNLTLATLAEDLALDEALLITAEATGLEYLRIWEASCWGVVLGKNCSAHGDVALEACRQDAIDVRRRASGGGTVLVGPGCLNYSLILRINRSPSLHNITESFDYVLDRQLSAIRELEPRAFRAGSSDLVIDHRKFSGNCQRRQRTHFLHHGTILYDFDLAKITSYLREPARQPDYRQRREHALFLSNISVARDALLDSLSRHWHVTGAASAVPESLVQDLVGAKYGDARWVYRL